MSRIITLTLNPALDKTCAVKQVRPEDKLRCHDIAIHPGGGGINVARAATRLGGQALAIWTRGGQIGDLLESQLNEEGVPQQAIAVADMTRENLIVQDQTSNQQYRFGMPGAELNSSEIQSCIDAVLEAVRQTEKIAGDQAEPIETKSIARNGQAASSADTQKDSPFEDESTSPDLRPLVVLSGSLPPGCADEQYQQIIDRLPPETRVVLDTSGPALQAGAGSGLFLIKPNMRELSALAGRTIEDDGQIRDVARRLIDDGSVEAVVTSLGSGGAVLTTSELHEHIRSPTVEIRSKVGAGDSMVAGMVVALSRQQSLLEAARFGVAAGAAAVMTHGTELCRRSETERLYDQMM